MNYIRQCSKHNDQTTFGPWSACPKCYAEGLLPDLKEAMKSNEYRSMYPSLAKIDDSQNGNLIDDQSKNDIG